MSQPLPCPWCAAEPGNLFIAEVLVAKELGTWSLSGMQPKVVAQGRPVLVCRSCRRERIGTMVPPAHCSFNPSGETEELNEEQFQQRLSALLREA